MADRRFFYLASGLTAAILGVSIALHPEVPAEKISDRTLNSDPNLRNVRHLPQEDIPPEESENITVLKEKLPIWDASFIPGFIGIPDIGFSAPIQLVDDQPLEGDSIAYLTPDAGLATPKNQSTLNKNLFIFGHSRYLREMRTFSKIQDLEPGNVIQVSGNRGTFYFSVESFGLINIDEQKLHLENLSGYLILQTTAVTLGEPILDEDLLIRKVINPEVTGTNLALLVLAKQISEREAIEHVLASISKPKT